MPLYSYECTNCGVVFERQQKFTDKPIKRCPECGKNTVRRVIQPAGIIFKGSGWYKTDSRSSSSDSGSSSSSKSKKSSAKTESKPDSKPETKAADSSSTPASSSSTSSKSSSSSDSD